MQTSDKNLKIVFREYKEGDEAEIINIINEAYDKKVIEKKTWFWKYKNHPNFSPENILVCERKGEIIASAHSTIQKLRFKDSQLLVGIGSDVVVKFSYRKQGIGLNLFKKLGDKLMQNGVSIRIGFFAPQLLPYYRKLGYIPIPTSTIIYRKNIGLTQYKKRILCINKRLKNRKDMHDVNLSIKFDLEGLPPFIIKVMNGKVDFITSKNIHHILIKGDPRFLKPNIFILLKGIISRKLRVEGSLRYFPKFLKIFKILRTS